MLLLEIADFVLGVIQCTFLSLGTHIPVSTGRVGKKNIAGQCVLIATTAP